MITDIFAIVFGYVVTGNGYKKTHYCTTKSEALSWLACYPDGATILKRGKFYAARKQEQTQ